MRKALCIINGYAKSEASLHYYSRMKDELAKLDFELQLKTNQELLTYINENGDITNKIKGQYEFCLYLDKDGYISKMLEISGLRLFNSSRAIYLCDDKMLTHIFLANKGIKMPKTYSAPLNYSLSNDPLFLGNIEQELTFPIIAKRNYGSLGKGVFMLNNHEELLDFENKYKSEPHIYQEFIDSSFGFDYRMIVVGGKFIAGMKRYNDNGDFRSNIAQGGKSKIEKIGEAYISLAEKAAKELGLDYCGIDLLQGKNGEPILCEVNSNAFLDGIERTTGINVAKAYAKHIVDSLENKTGLNGPYLLSCRL